MGSRLHLLFFVLALTIRAKEVRPLLSNMTHFQLYHTNNIVNNHGRLGFAYQYECNMSDNIRIAKSAYEFRGLDRHLMANVILQLRISVVFVNL